MNKLLNILLIASFLFSSTPGLAGTTEDKLAYRSNLPEIAEEYLPRLQILKDRIARGKIKRDTMPAELQNLWDIIQKNRSATAKETPPADLQLLPEEIKLIEEYITLKGSPLLQELLQKLVPEMTYLTGTIPIVKKGDKDYFSVKTYPSRPTSRLSQETIDQYNARIPNDIAVELSLKTTANDIEDFVMFADPNQYNREYRSGNMRERAGLLFGIKEGNRYIIQRIVPYTRYKIQDELFVEPDHDHIKELIDKYAKDGILAIGEYHGWHPHDNQFSGQAQGPSKEDRLGDLVVRGMEDRIVKDPIGIVFEPNVEENAILQGADAFIAQAINMYPFIIGERGYPIPFNRVNATELFSKISRLISTRRDTNHPQKSEMTGKDNGSFDSATLLAAMRADNGVVDPADLKRAEKVTENVDRATGISDEDKAAVAQELVTAHLQHSASKIESGRKKIKGNIDRYNILKGRITQTPEMKKYILLDKNALPEGQKYILEGNEWQTRKRHLEHLFPGYIFITFSSESELPKDKINKNNSIMLLSETNSKKYETFNTRFIHIQNSGERELYPLDALLCLGIGLLNISKTDLSGSPLASSLAGTYKEITGNDINIAEFLTTYKIEILLPSVQTYDTEEIMELQSFALSLLAASA
jgi:hypothetical protein